MTTIVVGFGGLVLALESSELAKTLVRNHGSSIGVAILGACAIIFFLTHRRRRK